MKNVYSIFNPNQLGTSFGMMFAPIGISLAYITSLVYTWVEEASRMPDGSEFHTAGAATLKPREAKVV